MFAQRGLAIEVEAKERAGDVDGVEQAAAGADLVAKGPRTPSKEMATSVPWSASKPRRKYWLALPPPECWTTNKPGTVERMSAGRGWGRSKKSRSRALLDEAACRGCRA